MLLVLSTFAEDTEGVITVDWVVLAKAVGTRTSDPGAKIQIRLDAIDVPTPQAGYQNTEYAEDDPVVTLEGPPWNGWHTNGFLYEDGQIVACS